MQNNIYFDHASTTQVHDEVLKTYKKLLDEHFANSEALYSLGSQLANLQEQSRQFIAKAFSVKKEEVIFTGGASEANNIAIKGVCFAHQNRKHLITTHIEHSSVFNAFKQLETMFGFQVDYLHLKDGVLDIEELKRCLRKDTLLVSVMYVNNELGTLQDIKQIKDYVKKHSNAYIHVDCVQALGKLPIDLKDIDLATFSAHKINGLKGSGLLVKKQHVKLLPLISGGQQEYGIHGGTSNSLVNILFAKTLRIALQQQASNQIHIQRLSNYLLHQLETLPVKINRSANSVDFIVSITTRIKSEIMINALNEKGIYVSGRSTCSSKDTKPSRVLLDFGLTEAEALKTIRISFGKSNTIEEIDIFIKNLKEIIDKYATD